VAARPPPHPTANVGSIPITRSMVVPAIPGGDHGSERVSSRPIPVIQRFTPPHGLP
jgi:hypothetical protein